MTTTRQTSPTLEKTSQAWPDFQWDEWQETGQTFHMWLQIVGKIRLALATRINHWWHVTLYPTSRGLTTSPMPYGSRTLQIDFDFLDHQLIFQTSEGSVETLSLQPMTVADFYTHVMACLQKLNMPVTINTLPSEVPDPIPFDQNHQHAAYDADVVSRFWQILVQSEQVFTQFRARFLGKVSPVHFFWGGMDLAVTRFSGRPAPQHGPVPNIPNHVVQTAYSHEVSSCGFWPGNPMLPEPAYYAYAYPTPDGFGDMAVQPKEAVFNATFGEFLLPYAAVRQATDPESTLLAFLQTTYEATATLAHWDRKALEAVNIQI